MKYLALVLLGLLVSASATDWTQLVPIPSGLSNQNGHTYLRHSTMMSLFGAPCAFKTDCQSVSNPKLKPLTVLESVGPFRVTGMKPAVDALRTALSNLQKDHPDLYSQLSSAGMLCCRAVRGSRSSYSNHAWGAAIDIKINGKLDPRADGKTQLGLKTLYPYMAQVGFFWAAGYSPKYEDAMHFEISEQTMALWATDGTLFKVTPKPGVNDCAWPVVRRSSSRSTNNYAVQYMLADFGLYTGTVDGLFGSGTEAAVKSFQTSRGLTSDGVVGGRTWTSLWNSRTVSTSTPAPSNAAKAVQDLLNRNGGASLVVDGHFGSKSVSAVNAFQRARGFVQVGEVNLDTFKALLTGCAAVSTSSTFSSASQSGDPAFEGIPEDNTNTSPSNTDTSDSSKDGISTGGIVTVALVVVAAAAMTVAVVVKRHREQDQRAAESQGYSAPDGEDAVVMAQYERL